MPEVLTAGPLYLKRERSHAFLAAVPAQGGSPGERSPIPGLRRRIAFQGRPFRGLRIQRDVRRTSLSHAQANISTEEVAPPAEARLPGADEHAGRTGRPPSAAPEGPPSPGRRRLSQGKPRYVLPRAKRLTGKGDFARVMDEGRSRSDPLVILRFLANGTGHPRLGFTASRGIGTIVRRNRAKRLLREAARHMPLQGGWDLVFIARTGAADARLQDVWASVEDVLRRTPAWAGPPPPQQERNIGIGP
jgi:ribonuclease P protein component